MQLVGSAIPHIPGPDLVTAALEVHPFLQFCEVEARLTVNVMDRDNVPRCPSEESPDRDTEMVSGVVGREEIARVGHG